MKVKTCALHVKHKTSETHVLSWCDILFGTGTVCREDPQAVLMMTDEPAGFVPVLPRSLVHFHAFI